ncbi:MAG: adenylate/guanylate cyclase domain-containing protein, partial [Desulfobacula sp.]|nr:adenylate/guanylate cyclase domain-containing protein [Desulfobacula sp.]
TTVSEKLSPTVLVGLLNEYFTEMTDIIFQHDGIIDKYQGDAIMAEFGIPIPTNDHADQAVIAALKMQNRLVELRKSWLKRGLPQLHCRVGINTNNMIIGNIGSPEIFDYTVIGDAVNLASRLEGANKRYGTSLIISQGTYDYLTPGRFKYRILDFITVKGKTKPIKIYEVYGLQNENSDPLKDKYYHIYNKAFEIYLFGDFLSAKDSFLEALSLRHEDPASQRLINRIKRLVSGPIPDGWDGSVSLTTK